MDRFHKFFLYLTIFVSGAGVLVLEIFGTRIIGPFYGATIFVWTSLITVTLGALALGYFVGGRVIDKYPRADLFYFLIFLIGLLSVVPMKVDQFVLPLTNDFGLRFGPLVAALILFFLPLFFAGMVSPSAIRLLTASEDTSGSSSGMVFAISTIGSIVGAFISGFYLLDKLSISESLNILGGVLVAISLVGLLLNTKKKVNLLTLASIFLILTQLPSYKYTDTYTLQIHEQFQSFYADLKVMEIGTFKCLAMNGSLQSCTNLRAGKPTFTYIAETERIISNLNPKNMLLVGLGTGDILQNLPPSLEVDVVELDPSLQPIAKEHFDLSDDWFRSLIIDDGRHFFNENTEKYDLILVDTFLGNTLPPFMFSIEAMKLWEKSLTKDGLVLVNFEGKLGDRDRQLKTVMRTASEVFSAVRLTTTEEESYISVLLHLSSNKDYAFRPGGNFTEVYPDYSSEAVMTDDFNSLDILSIPKLEIFRDEMINVGGLRLLFSI